MHLIDSLKRWLFGDPLAPLREQVERERLEAESRAIKATEGLFDIVDPREPYTDDGGNWFPIGGEYVPRNVDSRARGEVLPVYLTELGLKAIRDRSRELCAFSGHAINAKENRINYSISMGLSHKLIPRAIIPDDLREGMPDREMIQLYCRAGQAVIDEFCVRNRWAERQQETLLRADEDGEGMVRLFRVGGGRTEVRFVEPEHLKSPQGDVYSDSSLGVQNAPEDVEDVEGYWIVERPWESVSRPEMVQAEDVCHLKLNVRTSAKRGYPTFWPVRDHLERADRLLRNCSILSAVRATYAAIIKRKNSTRSIETGANARAEQTTIDPVTGVPRRFVRRLPGGVVETDAMAEYEFPGANLSAAEYVTIYEAELRAIAARLNMPEYMLTANAANNNYASILMAESPASRNFQRLQGMLFAFFGDGVYVGEKVSGVLWRVLKIAADAGIIPYEVLTYCQLQTDGPSVVTKDKFKETERNKSLSEKGLLSDRTWSADEALDYDQEQSNRMQEAEQRRAAKEKEEKTDKQTLIDLQKAYYANELPREAALATAQVVFSYSADDAQKLFPAVTLPRPVNPA